jgi:hypothetical protein
MPDQPNFPIPADLTPDTFCLCLQIPNDPTWISNFVGLLAQPTYWFNWQRDEARSGKVLAQYWTKLFDQIDWSTMSCCCPTPLIIINADGSISVSTDGGVTYHPDNSADPRYTLPQPPPLPGDDGPDKKCAASNAIVRQMKDIQAGNAAQIGTATTLAAMAAATIALAILVFFDPALIPFLIGLVFELAAMLLGTTASAYNALFTDDVWSWILCEFYCKMSEDGQIPADQFVNIQADFDTHFSGDVALTFSTMLNVWQLPGLNRAAKMATTDNLSCDGCCPSCTDLWQLRDDFPGDFGVITERTSTSITIETTIPIPSTYYIDINTGGVDDCCYMTSYEILASSASVGLAATNCGSSADPVITIATEGCFNRLQPQSSQPFTIKFNFSECP